MQDGLDSSISAIDAALIRYPIWNRDSRAKEADLEHWPGYVALLEQCTSPCQQVAVDMRDEAAWLHVVRRLDPRKATGVCGWSNSDLRQLPDLAIRDLALIPRIGASLSIL